MPKILITGSRNWTNYGYIYTVISSFPKDSVIIHGGCPTGADHIADCIAYQLRLTTIIYHADWNSFGKRAGPIRNQQMVDSKPDICFAFSNDLSQSRGTADCVNRAKAAGILVNVISESK